MIISSPSSSWRASARPDLREAEVHRRGPERGDDGVVEPRDRHADALAAEVRGRRQRPLVADGVLQEPDIISDSPTTCWARSPPSILLRERAREDRSEQRLVGDEKWRLERLQAPDAELVPRRRLDDAEVVAAVTHLPREAHEGVGRVVIADAGDGLDADAALGEPAHLVGEERREVVVLLVRRDPQRDWRADAARLVGAARTARREQSCHGREQNANIVNRVRIGLPRDCLRRRPGLATVAGRERIAAGWCAWIDPPRSPPRRRSWLLGIAALALFALPASESPLTYRAASGAAQVLGIGAGAALVIAALLTARRMIALLLLALAAVWFAQDLGALGDSAALLRSVAGGACSVCGRACAAPRARLPGRPALGAGYAPPRRPHTSRPP